MRSIQIHLFGVPRVESNATAQPIPRRKVVALLAYLSVTGQPHSRDHLAALFWPDNDQSSARANLRRDLYWLKQALGEAALELDREQAGLNPQAGLWLDVREFQNRIAQAKDHDCSTGKEFDGACAECRQALTEAVELYTGDFMAGFSLPDSPDFDEWQFFQAEGLRQSLGEALQQLIQWHTAAGEYERGIEACRRWLALDHLHEPAHRQLMQLYAWSGQQAAALRQYQECARLLAEELDVEPEEATTAVYEAIRSRQFSMPVTAGQDRSPPGLPAPAILDPKPVEGKSTAAPHKELLHNLPVQPTLFVGRDKELAEIRRLIAEDPGCRLLTLLGPGGSGKTRLALQSAADLLALNLECFSDGVWFVPLAPVNDAGAILIEIARSLNFTVYGNQEERRQQLLDYLHDRRLLLLLDNLEHLVGPESLGLIGDILNAAPKVKILATSRVRINARSEQLFPVSGLSVPPVEDDVLLKEASATATYSAIQLFAQSARRVQPDFALRAENLQAAVRICRLVEGLPLGIELAATWLEVLSAVEVADEIERSLDFLEAEWQDIPERQRSLRAVFDSSWKLLTEPERNALKSFSVFQGCFSRQAAQEVTGASLKTLLALAHKSWFQFSNDGRYQIHEMLRQYAAEKLRADPEAWHQAGDRHSHYYAAFLKDREKVMKSQRQKAAFQEIDTEYENIRAAWSWLVAHNRFETAVLEMLPGLFRYCEARTNTEEQIQLLKAARQALADNGEASKNPTLQAILLTAQAAFSRPGFPIRFAMFGMLVPFFEEEFQEAWAIAGETRSLHAMGFWGIMLAYLYGRIVDPLQGVQYLRELLPLFRAQGQPWDLATGLYLRGCLPLTYPHKPAEKQPAFDAVEQDLLEALAIFEQIGDQREIGCTRWILGNLYMFENKSELAIENCLVAETKLQEVDDWVLTANIQWQMGDIYLRMGEFEAAFRSFRTMSRIFLERGHRRFASYLASKESYEALRYSEIEHALQTRQECLNLVREIGDLFGEAWSTWEMGEIYRVAGDLAAARQWYDHSVILFEKCQDKNGLTFYHRGLGDLANTTGNFEEGQRQFQISYAHAEAADHTWGMIYASNGLGRATLGLGQLDRAQEHFIHSLRWARRLDDPPSALIALTGLAGVAAAKGEAEQAVELGAFVIHHHASWKETKGQAKAVLAQVTQLSSDEFAAAQARGHSLELWQVASQFLEGVPKALTSVAPQNA